MSTAEQETGGKKDSKMHIWVDEPTTNTLRELAAALKVFIRRGQGAGKIGNVAGLFQAVAQAWQRSPEIVLALIGMIQMIARSGLGTIRPWTSLSCGHAWLGLQDPTPEVCQVCGDSQGPIQAVVDTRRALGESRPYEEETAWGKSANSVLEGSSPSQRPQR